MDDGADDGLVDAVFARRGGDLGLVAVVFRRKVRKFTPGLVPQA